MNNSDFYYTWKSMLAAYYEEELQFLEFNRLIPIKDNSPDTSSIRLYGILQSTCGQVENMMKILCDRLKIEIEKNQPKFPDLFDPLNKEGMLSDQIIYSIKKDNVLSPFLISHGDFAPKWWMDYNNTKHDLPEGFKKGNINNTVFSLAALYSLHVISYYVYHQGTMATDLLKRENWYCGETSFSQNMYDEIYEKEHDPRPRSELFYSLSKLDRGAEFH